MMMRALKLLGLTPVESGTAWNVKLILSDVDSALSKRGEMIGAVLIVGGPEVVPFHLLPNPVDDQDNDVPSDNPYATRDENYFMPEWPVGRLPGGSGDDASLLLAMLRRYTKNHQKNNYPKPWYRRLWHLFIPNHNKAKPDSVIQLQCGGMRPRTFFVRSVSQKLSTVHLH